MFFKKNYPQLVKIFEIEYAKQSAAQRFIDEWSVATSVAIETKSWLSIFFYSLLQSFIKCFFCGKLRIPNDDYIALSLQNNLKNGITTPSETISYWQS